MRRNIVLWGMAMSFLLGVSCTKNEDNDVGATGLDLDWYAVEDLPGEYNQLRYELYRDHGLTVLTTDTLGQVDRGLDGNGKPVIHTEIYNFEYNVYGEPSENFRFVLSRDKEACFKAMQAIRKWVCPYLPTNKLVRPKVIFLTDSLLYSKALMGMHDKGLYSINTYEYAEAGIPLGGVDALREKAVDDLEWRCFAGRILAFHAVRWFNENMEDESAAWATIDKLNYNKTKYTDDFKLDWIPKMGIKPNGSWGQIGWMRNTVYLVNYWSKMVVTGNVPPRDTSFVHLTCEDHNFLNWYTEGKMIKRTTTMDPETHEEIKIVEEYRGAAAPSSDSDMLEYIAYYYAYLGQEAEFEKKYAAYPTILKKMRELRKLMKSYEDKLGMSYPAVN